ncbi:MAG: S-methyl-5-thioribose-1-phosphate isomerase [Dehalococcoidia bacterium]|nr:S-methyl-5-thioribose-1-phosphate isomerase [Dehalococcoidia bacterium]
MVMKPLEWLGDRIRIIDQTKLPAAEVYLELHDYREVAEAIRRLSIRGAPLIGVAAAYGFALGALSIHAGSREEFLGKLDTVNETLAGSRPTAVNLFWALERMNRKAREPGDITDVKGSLVGEARRIEAENEEADRALGEYGAEFVRKGTTILTHCNAGSLATGGNGTALGVIKTARRQGKGIEVYATETRPLLQGARLTAWELTREDIPVTLITDSMAGSVMKRGLIDCVIVGADRIAANGDVANKIGTYSLAVLAAENAIPFFVAAPTSTIDLSTPSGDSIPIEERDPGEVTHLHGKRIAPEGVKAANPAFDVTPHCYVSRIITERGAVREPYIETLRELVQSQ